MRHLIKKSPNDSDAEVLPTLVSENNKDEIHTECRFFYVPRPLAEIMIGDPLFGWSALLLPPTDSRFYKLSNNTEQGQVSTSTSSQWCALPQTGSKFYKPSEQGQVSAIISSQVPSFVRFMEKSNCQAFNEMIKAQPSTEILSAPILITGNRQNGTVGDTTLQYPFVTSFIPTISDTEVDYEPVWTIINEGLSVLFQMSVCQNDSCCIEKLNVTSTKILKTATFTCCVRPDVVGDEIKKIKKEQEWHHCKKGMTLQCPHVRTIQAALSDIVIPKGMSVLIAVPGIEMPSSDYFGKKNDSAVFLLVTPRVVHR